MNIKELIEMLNEYPEDTQIILASDPEGNGYGKLSAHDVGKIAKEELAKYHIDDYCSDGHSDEDCDLEPGERDTMEKVIVLWP
jgi:hypothetical protein